LGAWFRSRQTSPLFEQGVAIAEERDHFQARGH
jgi:hypothetical protein